MPELYHWTRHTLSNGLRVVINEDHTAPSVALNLWVNVGSRHEQPGRTGFAHLFEHLMFQGSRNVPAGSHFADLMAAGGSCNATTWFDRTNYFDVVPTHAFELACWLEADRHAFLLDAVTQANLDNQREVVLQEKAERNDNVPYGHATHELLAMLFPLGHPYAHPVIGSMDDLHAATLDDVHAFFTTHYHPVNTVAVVCGDVDTAYAVDALEKYFGPIPAGQVPEQPVMPALPPLSAPVRQVVHSEVPAARVYLGYRLPADHTPEFMAAWTVLDVAAGLLSSRLETLLVRGDRSCNHVFVGTSGLAGGTSWGYLCGHLADGADPAHVENAMLSVLADLGTDGPTEEELATVVAQSERGWLSELAGIEDRADLFNHYTTLYNDPNAVNTYLDQLDTITVGHVAAAARTWLTDTARATLIYLPVDNSLSRSASA